MFSLQILKSIRNYIDIAATSPELLATFHRTQKDVKFLMLIKNYYFEEFNEFSLLIGPTKFFKDKYKNDFNHFYFMLNRYDSERLYGKGIIVSIWCKEVVTQEKFTEEKVVNNIKKVEANNNKFSLKEKFNFALHSYKLKVHNVEGFVKDIKMKDTIKENVKIFLETEKISFNENASDLEYFIFREVVINIAFARIEESHEANINMKDSDIDFFIDLVQVPKKLEW